MESFILISLGAYLEISVVNAIAETVATLLLMIALVVTIRRSR